MKNVNFSTKIKIYISITCVLLFVLIILNSLFGNPISKNISNKKIRSYIHDNYKNLNLTIDEPMYNFKMAEYFCKVYSKTQPDVYFEVSYRDKEIFDSYKYEVLSGQNTVNRIEREYADILTPLLKKEFGASFDRVRIDYSMEDVINKNIPKLNEPLDINDRYYKEILLDLKDTDMTVESFSFNLTKLNSILIKNGYNIDEYMVWIGEPTDDYAYISGIKPSMIDEDLIKLIQYCKDNKKEAFQRYEISITL
ncbi:MAG: DUF3139 domain-containing protein [Tepidibacter sp.]|jgi:hypothetical protein|uniref:YfjL-like protein n=1 Tax=Tepidibacter sp. TaxID=2529387 RepID=UPI0025F51971|nr:DUF3139 domain-containing protein [Tepidibacter sp.]MCT4508946.1 DUF3139 domain-containing protein [Tepidibacter sp.]